MVNLKKILALVPMRPFHWVGDGLPVHNYIDYNGIGKQLNPFILLDYGAPYSFAPHHTPRGVGMHPHRGFETLTIAFQGEITHTDSLGQSDTIFPGDAQWMTAGSGIEHSEMHSDNFTRTGGVLEMVQLWINLPAKDKMTPPGYQSITADTIPKVPLVLGDGTVDILAGEYNSHKGPASTYTPMNVWSVKLIGDTNTLFTVPENWVSAVLVRRGEVTINGKAVGERNLVAMDRSGTDVSFAATNGTEFVFLAGEPIDEPIAAHGPMVMNTRQELVQAFEDYQGGLFREQR